MLWLCFLHPKGRACSSISINWASFSSSKFKSIPAMKNPVSLFGFWITQETGSTPLGVSMRTLLEMTWGGSRSTLNISSTISWLCIPEKKGGKRMKGAKCQLFFLGILACHDVCYPVPPCSLYHKGLNSLEPEAEISISSLNMFILGG